MIKLTHVYIYSDTGYFAEVSSEPINQAGLTEVPSLPPNLNYKWLDNQWVFLDASELEIIAEVENLPVIDPTEDFAELKSQNILLLNDLNGLVVSQEEKVNGQLVDVRYYKNSPVKSANDGIYIDRTGWMAFPSLQWSRNNLKTVDFIFWLKGNSYFSLGLLNENFNPNNTRTTSSGIVYAIRFSKDTLSHCYGNGLTNYYGYQKEKRNYTYRLRINKNALPGSFVELFRLKDKAPENWHKGIKVFERKIDFNFERSGDFLTPVLLEKNNSSNPLLGVIVSS